MNLKGEQYRIGDDFMLRFFEERRSDRSTHPMEPTISWWMLLLGIWLVILMLFMDSLLNHIVNLGLVSALSIILIWIAHLFHKNKYQGYITAILATIVSVISYFLLRPVIDHTEVIFALMVIAISARWGAKQGFFSAFLAFLSNLTLTISSGHTNGHVEGLAAGGFFLIAAFIVGSLTQQRESALTARARMGEELNQTYTQTLRALVSALDTRDRETSGHSERVTAITLTIAREMKLDPKQIQQLHWGAILHDVGKIGVPDNILRKPGPLTDEEWILMRKHPEMGFMILNGIPFLNPALDIVRYHHERYDGTGYPSRLSGETIPLSARIFAVADTYDAMTSDRPYRKALSHEDAVAEICRLRNKQFDPIVVDAFLGL